MLKSKSKAIILEGEAKEMLTDEGDGGWWVGYEVSVGLLQASCVMCCQNIWVTKSCPATQTIEAEPGRPGKWVQTSYLQSSLF